MTRIASGLSARWRRLARRRAGKSRPCRMPNHFHLVVETPQGNLAAGMKWFLGTYTGRFNRRHKLFGHLFSGRYKALVVDGSGSGYLKTVCDYVPLNPVRARLLGPEAALRQ